MFQPFSTPTDLRIRKAAGGGYLLETLVEQPITIDPVTHQPKIPCGGRVQVRGHVFTNLDDCLKAAGDYLAAGKGCHCEDCDH